jgi:dipeptidyl aminopeptidase/acylaminoacyl peptidase
LRSLPLLAAATLLAACGASENPAVREVPRYTIEQFLGNTNLAGASFSPDQSKLLVSSDETGIYNAFAVPTAGGAPVQLTSSTGDAIFAIGYFPTDERFLYSSDQGGNELHHIYVRDPDGTVRDLTPGERLTASFAGWARDDHSFFFMSNERDPRYFDLYELTVADYERTLLYRNDNGYDVGAISPDRRYLALVKSNTTNDNDLYLLDRQTDELKLLTPGEGPVQSYPTGFSPDGASLYFVTDEGSEFTHLVRYDLASGERESVLAADWDIMYASFSRTGKYLVVGINNDARTEIRILETETMRQVTLPEVPSGDITSVTISRDEKRVAFYVSSGRSPRDLFIFDLGDRAARQLTRTMNPGIDPDNLVEPDVVRFTSYDGVEVPGLLYRPHAASPTAKVPALIWIHGGPGGQSRVGYSGLIQYLVNHGYAVYAINNRGSSGYGKTFYAMDDQRHGEADLDDVVASKEMLIGTGYVDPEKIGVIGGSYGGYLTMAALAFRPDEFTVGIDIFGVTNWLRTLESIPPWWESYREALYAEMGDPATDRDRLHRISPLFHADKITRPFLVLQGANDPRVLQVESDEIVAAARANGIPVEYIVFPDEGHGFVKKENQLRGYRAILEFLDQHMKGQTVAATP